MRRGTMGPSPLHGHSKLYLTFFALVAVLAVTGAAMAAAPQEGGSQTVMAEFRNVGPIANQTVVRIGGVDVGTTSAPTVDPDRKLALLPLNLDGNAFPLYKNATAKIDQLSLVGEKYVVLSPGTPDAGVMSPGEPIAAAKTNLAEDYQNLIQPLNDPTAAGLASIARELGQGIQGRGQNVQDILARFGPAFNDTNKLLEAINRQNGVLGQIVDQVQPLANGLAADQGRTLDGTLNSANSLLNTTTVNEQQLRATIRELPDTLAAAQRTLTTLAGTAGETQDTLREARPVTDNLSQISRELRGFTDAANPALKALNPLLDRASELLDEARPLAAELKRTGDPLYDTVHNLRPVAEGVGRNLGGPYGKGPDKRCFQALPTQVSAAELKDACLDPRVQGILGLLHNFALASNRNDAISHYVGIFVTIDQANLVPQGGDNLSNEPCAFQGPGSNPFFCINGKPRAKGQGQLPFPGGFPDNVPQGQCSDPNYLGDYEPGREICGGGKGKGGSKKPDNQPQYDQAKANTAVRGALPGLNKTILRGDAQPGGSATGLTPTQEQNALGTLMGGR